MRTVNLRRRISGDHSAERADTRLAEEIEGFKCFFVEPYFARMDLYDDKEGYNSYYIEKRETSIWRSWIGVRRLRGNIIRRARLSFPSTNTIISRFCAVRCVRQTGGFWILKTNT